MKSYKSIADIKYSDTENFNMKRFDMEDDVRDLLLLLEKVNPCRQRYHIKNDTLLVTYMHRLNLLNFTENLRLTLPVRIVAMPVSIELPGVFGSMDDALEIIRELKGLTLILNSDTELPGGGCTLSSFVFQNEFTDFEDYMNSLRSSYRRRIRTALEKGNGLHISRIEVSDFSEAHYDLYRCVYERSGNKLELLPIEFFRMCGAEVYEFRDPSNDLLAFVQILERKNELMFLFCGFREEDVKSCDIYMNMLLFILKEGIRRGSSAINFGQTSEETKSKLGCEEVEKYLHIHHSNPIINCILQKLTPHFSYKGYPCRHRVYKEKS